MKSRRRNARLYVVGAACVLVTLVLWGRLAQIQHVRHQHYLKVAVRQRVQPRDIPPVRGGIFDRTGRPLALNVRLCAVGVSSANIKDRSAVATVLSAELKIPRNSILKKIRAGNGFVFVSRQCQLTGEQRDRLLSVSGVTVDYEPGRVYPYGSVAAKLIGFVGHDNVGQAGVEVAFNADLCGVPGRELVIRNGRYASDRYHRTVERRPENGRHVYLTIDVAVQELAEVEIRRAVKEHEARSGVVIVMDVATGDILALAEYPCPSTRTPSSHADTLWTIRSLSHVYEPGSTFKIVTAAALLESRGVTPADVFDAEQGRADLGYAVINDPHPHGRLTFAEAFAYSSNVVMAKASRLVAADEFYKYVRLFGFGAKTGIRMKGESAGFVPEVAGWSKRTQSTMAFGQEIAVTPLQMLSAYAAIANDGVMMLPRLIKGVADEESGDVTKFDPVKVRRVVSKETARTLRDFCREVVDYGTGVSAAVECFDVSGKTGTGQKASRRGGYLPGKFISSFVGFAPHEEPRIACLVLLDEPRWRSRYGGTSAAPVFARLCRSLANGTDIFDGVLESEHLPARSTARTRFSAPNFLRMDRADALDRARRLGANVLCRGDAGRVVSQRPAPGVAMDKDDVIRLQVARSKGKASGSRSTPDLRGLTMREARRRAAQHGFIARFVGSGVVTRQSPNPGKKTDDQLVKLYCDGSVRGGAGRSGGSR